MTRKSDIDETKGVSRRDLMKAVGVGAAGLALAKGVRAHPAEEHDAGKSKKDSGRPIHKHKAQPGLEDVDEVLGFISPTHAISFKVPKP